MIRILLCSLFLINGCDLSLVAEDLRVWHDRNGQEIRAILKKLDGDKVLMLKDGKEFLFQVSILSDEDQAYLRDRASKGTRAVEGLLALYDFGSNEGSVVKDVSGVEPALDLQIANDKAVMRIKGSLEVRSQTMIKSIKEPTKIIKAIKNTRQLTVEAWVQPANLKQEGPARIVMISKDTSNRNFTLGQEGHRFDIRLRTSKTSRNGLPSLATPAKSVTTKLSHLAYSRERSGKVRFFVNGKQVGGREANGKTILENSLFTISTESGDGRHNDTKRELSGVFHAISSANGLFKTGSIMDLKAEAIDVYNTMLTSLGAKRRLGDKKRNVRAG